MLINPSSGTIAEMASAADLPLSQQRTGTTESTPMGRAPPPPSLLQHNGSLRDTVVIQTPSPVSSRYFDPTDVLSSGAWSPSPDARQVCVGPNTSCSLGITRTPRAQGHLQRLIAEIPHRSSVGAASKSHAASDLSAALCNGVINMICDM